jgi:multidrug resistance protein, MATE family
LSDPPAPKLGHILHIALPVVISNASYTAMLFADRLFLSRVGKHELAATMSGGLTAFVLYAFFLGLVGYAAALVAQYYGAGKHQMCTRATTQAIYLSLASYPILLLFVPFLGPLFSAMGQDPSLAAPATTYARILLSGAILSLLKTAIGTFFIGIGRTRIVMVANICGTLFNLPLNYILIFGKFGLPAMGIEGAALGTVCSSCFIFLLLGIAYIRATSHAPYKVEKLFQLQPDIIRRLLRFGTPAGAEPFLTWFAFNLFILSLHTYGPDTAAAATIAFNYDLIAFVPMMGLGVAATTVVGQYIGAQDHESAEKATYLTLRCAAVYALALIVLYVAGADVLVRVFTAGLGQGQDQIATTAATMLRLMAFYILANAAKLVLTGALRGAGDTAWVMWVSVGLHWTMAVTASLLIHFFEVPPYTAWFTLIVMNNVHLLSVFYRFRTGKWKKVRLID